MTNCVIARIASVARTRGVDSGSYEMALDRDGGRFQPLVWRYMTGRTPFSLSANQSISILEV